MTAEPCWQVVVSKVPNDASFGKVVGGIVPLVYSNGTGYIGMFAVESAERGVGMGRSLLNATMAYSLVNGVRILGLTSVPGQEPMYERRGFVETGTHKLMTRRTLPASESTLAHAPPPDGCSVVNVRSLTTQQLVAYDLRCSGLERPHLWTQEALFHREDVFGFAAVDASDPSQLRGLVLVCKQEDIGYKFGPLSAETPEVAKDLLQRATLHATDEKYPLSIPAWSRNAQMLPMLEELGWWPEGFINHQMWVGGIEPDAQKPGGIAEKVVYAFFDGATG